jgi:hypothetical protein
MQSETKKNNYFVKCKNYLLCESLLSKKFINIYKEHICICIDCYKFGWNKLCIENRKEDCPVCLENINKQVKFPNCGHWFCLECSKKIMFIDKSIIHLSPIPYGCPPCPNGCINPIRGILCYCKEWLGYENNIGICEKWAEQYPEQYNIWFEKEYELFKECLSNPIYGKKICPLCRTKQYK